jgi:hypothetical protein
LLTENNNSGYGLSMNCSRAPPFLDVSVSPHNVFKHKEAMKTENKEAMKTEIEHEVEQKQATKLDASRT